jgi:hypothetical protein
MLKSDFQHCMSLLHCCPSNVPAGEQLLFIYSYIRAIHSCNVPAFYLLIHSCNVPSYIRAMFLQVSSCFLFTHTFVHVARIRAYTARAFCESATARQFVALQSKKIFFLLTGFCFNVCIPSRCFLHVCSCLHAPVRVTRSMHAYIQHTYIGCA